MLPAKAHQMYKSNYDEFAENRKSGSINTGVRVRRQSCVC